MRFLRCVSAGSLMHTNTYTHIYFERALRSNIGQWRLTRLGKENFPIPTITHVLNRHYSQRSNRLESRLKQAFDRMFFSEHCLRSSRWTNGKLQSTHVVMESLGFTRVFAVVPSLRRCTIEIPEHTKNTKKLAIIFFYSYVVPSSYTDISEIYHNRSSYRQITSLHLYLLTNEDELCVPLGCF